MYRIPFNQPFIVGKELYYISQSVLSGKIAGDGLFTKKCEKFLENRYGTDRILLTHSCTAALEMAAILCNIGPGDEVIMPSFTFVSTANAFYLRGAKIVFVDIRKDTLNMDETKLENAITPKTKVVVPVHYAGVACEMDTIMAIAQAHDLIVVEDAAQGLDAKYKNQYLGTIGDIGAFSFHETKNVISGEGGAISLNSKKFVDRAEIIREKGTDRSKFFRGEIDKYTWVDIGSSYLPSDIVAAFLFAQLENIDQINKKREALFTFYYQALSPLAEKGKLVLPYVSDECLCNNHMFYILLKDEKTRTTLIQKLKSEGILSVFHYLPLHQSPVGRQMGYNEGDLPETELISRCLLRLPFYYELTQVEQSQIIDIIKTCLADK
jgi:dTDP-4-amino-4,6-dideoxygalactose transaminase